MTADARKRRRLVPEVVQTSAMDCGPATLKCLLEGFGIRVSYGRLREACQTDVDGTSIDTVEEIAGQLGLEAEQIMLPPGHLLMPEAGALPAIVVVRQPNGLTHFVVVWRVHGPVVQVMDPAIGRRWISTRRFLQDVHVHDFPIAATYWREWAGSAQFLDPLRRRLAALGLDGDAVARLVEKALAEAGWRTLAALDAATRMTGAMVDCGGLARGRPAATVLESFFAQAREAIPGQKQSIPKHFWTVQPASAAADGTQQLLVRGAVLVRILGKRAAATETASAARSTAATTPERQRLSPELIAALEEKPTHPGGELLRLLCADGLLPPAAVLAALALGAGAVLFEALLFRGLFDLGRELTLSGQRLAAIGVLLLFAAALLALELPLAASLLRFGRRLEIRLRIAFLEKIPRLVDRYFQSRLTSDMAERSHSLHTLRLLPELSGLFLRYSFELLLTTAGIIWLHPPSAPLALLTAAASLAVPLLANPVLVERDLRIRTHVGALSRFYLDALLGLIAVRAHGAGRAVRSEHESLLVEWARASLTQQRTVVGVEALQAGLGFGLAATLVMTHLSSTRPGGAVLLLVYWALNLPVLGQEIALLVRQYPECRNLTLRLFEPLGAPERREEEPQTESRVKEEAAATGSLAERDALSGTATAADTPGATIQFEKVSVCAAGRTILRGVDLSIPAGSHVGVVGPSGAGKSSLVGLLLGWHRPASGSVRVDGVPLSPRRLEALRRQTAWVDPAVQLWNRSLLDNLRFGGNGAATAALDYVLDQAELLALLKKLPEGLQTSLGEGGGLVSGGEGQRVRLGRALLRPGVRLVILDEPFRGLDREARRRLLARVRELWRDATLLCITHDVGETQGFKRVLVVEGGLIAEDGAPAELAARDGSRYRALLEAEEAVRTTLWSSDLWRRQWLEGGRLVATAQANTGVAA